MHELTTPFQQYIHQSKYARWNDELGRRETWEETVDRYMDQVWRQMKKMGAHFEVEEHDEIREAILNLDVLPSMRALMTAGDALERDNVAGYNCAFVALNRVRAFSEILFILCCGTGVGFSVERQNVKKLPEIPDELTPTDTVIVVRDSKIGWADSYNELLSMLYAGRVPTWDTSKIRPAGARLKTFGGRASGPGPLEDLFKYTVQSFKIATGRRLNSDEVHGLVCKIGDIVVVGGVRRSALLSLFNPSDERMLNAKSGQWWHDNPHYRLANNSVAYTEKPDMERFIDKWKTLIDSKSGEPGIFNRQAAQKKVEASGRRDPDHDFGVNPCGEIILRDRQFCNLSEVVVRPVDTLDDLRRKVRLATILGTIQASFTDFRYLSKKWQENCEEEALLGVSLDGVMDHPSLSVKGDPGHLASTLTALKDYAVEINAKWAERLGINPAAAITCSKPSGNSSQLVDCSSGMHTRYAPYYVRRTRGSKTDPVSQVLYYSDVPTEDDIQSPETTSVFSWPIKAPEDSITRDDLTAIEQLEHWLIFAENWCEHNPSITISVRDDEWLEVGAFVYKHFDKMIGVTFMPSSDHVYQQAPYEEITQEEYEALVDAAPDSIRWDMLTEFETEDHTENTKELACVAGNCEL